MNPPLPQPPIPPQLVEAALAEVRRAGLSLPETVERLSHGAPSFFAGGKKCFVMFLDDHHGDGRLALWVAAPPGVQAEQVDDDPDRFFVPPYVGGRGWLGVRLDRDPDWDEVGSIVTEAWRCVAPKKLVAQFDAQASAPSPAQHRAANPVQ